MTVDLTPAELLILHAALGLEGSRLDQLAIRLKATNNPGFKQAYLRAGACSDLRAKLRAAAPASRAAGPASGGSTR